MLHLLLDAEVYDPALLGRRHLLVAGSRIVWMGEREPGPSAELGVQRHDLAGMCFVPGLIDLHAHLRGCE